jgi:tRNA pseudouridine synthase 10
MTILDDARALLETGPLCDACLGRPFADRSFGLRNDQRGLALRTSVALEDDADFEAGHPEDCWVCEGLCTRFDEWADRCVAALGDVEFVTYQLGTRVPPLFEENEALLREDAGLDSDAGEPLKMEVNREVGRRVGQRTGKEVDFERPDVQLILDVDSGDVEVQLNSVSIYGRYRKLVRHIPQTHWPEQYDESVEELVSPPMLSALRGTESVFHGAGREDVDALMLGTGRPFVVEIKHPHRREVDIEELEREVNDHAEGKVEVEGLRFATHDMVERVKEHAASKTYRAEVLFDAPVSGADLQAALDDLRGATIQQRTPTRVSHRRADLVRERDVYEISGEMTDDIEGTVDIHGAGGLYIKELVSGDEGRTEPSLAGLLGIGATVTALDVIAVEGEAEPFEDGDFLRAGEEAVDGAGGMDHTE